MVLGDVREMGKIVGVLAGAVNVAYFVHANELLSICTVRNANLHVTDILCFNVNPLQQWHCIDSSIKNTTLY